MKLTLQQSNHLKSLAILMMLCLHLFNRDYTNLFEPLLFIGHQPLSYYISLFSDACVPIFAFVSGYGLYYKYIKNQTSYKKENILRLKKLYINYWIILLIFAVGLGLFLNKDGYPGTISKLFLNITAIQPSYNGAWWFFTTYVLFVVSSNFWFSLIKKINPIIYLLALIGIYLVAFYFRIYQTSIVNNSILNWVHEQSALYFCTLFQFMVGAFALQFDWKNKIGRILQKSQYKNSLIILLIISLIILHAIFPNFIIAPFIGLGFILLFVNIDIPQKFSKILDFFTPHATNLWLIHMFFYMIYFPNFIYGFKYPLFIYSVLVGMCLISSYGVNIINKRILQWV